MEGMNPESDLGLRQTAEGNVGPGIFLNDVGGVSPLSGVDQYSRLWCEFWIDSARAGKASMVCAVCGRPIANGWICLSNGDSICHEHLVYQ